MQQLENSEYWIKRNFLIFARAGQLQLKEGLFVKDWPDDRICVYVDRKGGGEFEFTRIPLLQTII
jgi:hypothetical protein